MKRWISFLLALTLIVGMLPATPIHVHAAEHEDEVVVDETTISATEPAKEETTPPIMEASEEEVLLPAALDSSRAADSGAIPVLLGVNVTLNGNDILDTSDGWLPYLAIKSPVFEPGTGTANVEIKNSVLYTNGSFSKPVETVSAGGRYYFYIYVRTLTNIVPVDYSKISLEYINVTMDGYKVDFLYAEDYVSGAYSGKKFCFTATHDPAPQLKFGEIVLNDGEYLKSGTPITSVNKPSGGYAYYKDGVLELNNYNSSFGSLHLKDMKSIEIKVVGSNVLSIIEETYTSTNTKKYTDITFTGDGSLNVKSNVTACVKTSGYVTVNGGNLTFGGGNALSGLSAASLKVNGGELVLQGTTSAINSGCRVEADFVYVDESGTLWDGTTALSAYKYLRINNCNVNVGGVFMDDGTYLANGATSTTTTKPSGGYAYYKDGVLTLHNYEYSGEGFQYNAYFALVYAHDDLKIVLEGENTLNQTNEDGIGIYFGANGTIYGSGSLNIKGPATYGVHSEAGNLTFYGESVTISDCTHGVNTKIGDVMISGGSLNVTAQSNALSVRKGNVIVSDGELIAKSTNGSSSNRAINAVSFSFANHLTALAAETPDGTPAAYDAAKLNTYDLIMVKAYPILLGVKTTGGMVGESESGGSIYFDSYEGVFNLPCSEETTWTVSRLRTASGELNTMPVVGETYYFDITIQGENINFSGVSAMNCDVKLDFYDVAFENATYTDTSATIAFSAVRRLTHDVVFHLNGSAISGQTLEPGQLAVKPDDPGQEGVHFLGWFTEDGEFYDFDTPVTKDVNLYAKFGHYVTFWLEGDEYPIFGQEIEDGQCAAVPAEPAQEGYVFKGWYTEDDQPYDFATPVKADLNLYAKFTKLHTVSFYTGGADPVSTQDIEDGKTATQPEDPTQTGKKFLGWYTEDDEPYDFSTPVTGDLNIHAKFVKSHTVTLMFGDSAVGWLTVEDGKPVVKPDDPAQEGKIFVGWYTEDGMPYDFTKPVTRDINLIATFTQVAVDGVPLVDGWYLPSGSTTPTKTKPSGGYAYYKDGALTLSGYTNTGAAHSYKVDSYGDIWCSAIYGSADLNIVLTANTTNTITNGVASSSGGYFSMGISVEGKLTITGEGSLSVATESSLGWAMTAKQISVNCESVTANGSIYVSDNGALSMELSGSFLSDRYIQAGTINIKAKGDITLSSAEDSAYVHNYAETGSSSLISETGKVEIVSFESWALNLAHDLTVSAADTIYLESIGSNALGGTESNLTLTAPNGITINSPGYTSYVWDKLTATATNGAITVYGSLYTGEFDIRAKDDVTVNGGYIECYNSVGESSIVSESGNVSISSSGCSVDMSDDVTINAAKNISITADVPLGSTSYTLYGAGNLNLTAGENIELLTNSGYLGYFGGFNATATNGDFVAKGRLDTDTINIKAKGDVTVTDEIYVYEDEAHSIVSEAGNVTLSFTGDNSLVLNYGDMTVSAAKKLTITSPDYYAIYTYGNVTLNAGEGMEINSHPGCYIFCFGQQFIANVTGGDFVANSTFRVDNMTVTAAGDVTIRGQLELYDEMAKISSLNGDILISAPTGEEALYCGNYYFKAPNGTTTITSDVNNSRYGLINVDTITAEGPLKIVNPGGYALLDELKITGDEVTIIGDPTGTSDDPLTYENRNGKAYAVYEGASEAALTAADHEAAGEVYVGYLDTGVVKFVEEDYVSTQPVKKLELELEGFDTDSELLILKGKVTSTGATIRPGGYTRGVDVLDDSDGSPGYSTTKTRLNANTDYWIKFMVKATDGYSLADITAADVTLKGYEDITPILSYDEDSEILTLFFPMPQLKPVVRVGGVKMHNGEYLDESGKIHTTALTDNYAYFKDGVLTLHNYDYTGAGYKFYEEYYEGSYSKIEAAIHSRYDLEIVLDAGTVNTLNAEDLGIALFNYDGSFINAALTISGTGKLVVNSVDEGIYVPEGNFAANDADLEITSAAHAIRVYGDVTVTDASLDLDNATVEDQTIYISSDLTATGSDLVINSGDYGIFTLDNVVLKDCSLELQTVKTSIYAEGTISMDGCTATVNSGAAVSIGGYDIEIKNTDLTLDDCGIGMRASKYSYGGCKGSILIQDSSVEITADHDGIRADYDVTVDNSNVIVKTTDTGSDLNYFAIRIYSPGKLVLGENLAIQGSTDPDGTLGECDLTKLYNYDYIRITAPCTTHNWNGDSICTRCGAKKPFAMAFTSLTPAVTEAQLAAGEATITSNEAINFQFTYAPLPGWMRDEGYSLGFGIVVYRDGVWVENSEGTKHTLNKIGQYDVILRQRLVNKNGETIALKDFTYHVTIENPYELAFTSVTPSVTDAQLNSGEASITVSGPTTFAFAYAPLPQWMTDGGYTIACEIMAYQDGVLKTGEKDNAFEMATFGQFDVVLRQTLLDYNNEQVDQLNFTYHTTFENSYELKFKTMIPEVTAAELAAGEKDLGVIPSGAKFGFTYEAPPEWITDGSTNYAGQVEAIVYDYMDGVLVNEVWGHPSANAVEYECLTGGDHVIVLELRLVTIWNQEIDSITFTYKCSIIASPATGIEISEDSLLMSVGDTETLTAEITPADADPDVHWSSDNTAVATVDASGKVTAVSPGTAIITATDVNGFVSDTCIVSVSGGSIYVDGVALEPGQYLAQGARLATTEKPADNYVYYGENSDGDMQLTLHNYTHTGTGYLMNIDGSVTRMAIYAPDFVVLKLEGTNSIAMDGANWTYGVYLAGGSEIIGDGTLDIQNVMYGIYGKSGLSLEGGSITISDVQYGIFADGSVTFCGADVDVSANTGALEYMSGDCEITAGDLSFYAANGRTISTTSGDLSISGGSVSVVSDSQLAARSAIYNYNGTVTVSGGALYAEAYNTAILVTGEQGALAITGGELLAKSDSSALDISGTFTYGSALHAIASVNKDGSDQATLDKTAMNTYKYVFIGGETTGMKGDVNLDGNVDMNDAVALMQHVLKVEEITDATAYANSEVTNDESLDMNDAVKLMQYVLKVIDSLD